MGWREWGREVFRTAFKVVRGWWGGGKGRGEVRGEEREEERGEEGGGGAERGIGIAVDVKMGCEGCGPGKLSGIGCLCENVLEGNKWVEG